MIEDFETFRRQLAEGLVRIYNITPQELGVIYETKHRISKFNHSPCTVMMSGRRFSKTVNLIKDYMLFVIAQNSRSEE